MKRRKGKVINAGKIEISAVVIAKNEEKKITDCIKSCLWSDEVILIDNSSIDKTALIARRLGARVIKASEKYNLKYSDLRNIGLRKSKGKWIIYVDADERVTSELISEIQNIVKNNPNGYGACAIPRRNIILGREMRHGGWWPDYVKRLFIKKYLVGWKGKLHEEPVFKGQLGHLKNPMIHIKHDNLYDMVTKTNIWSEIEAKIMYNANHPKMNIVRFLTAVFREFWLRIIKKKAFLDGGEGIIYACYQVWSKFISYAKLWELQNN